MGVFFSCFCVCWLFFAFGLLRKRAFAFFSYSTQTITPSVVYSTGVIRIFRPVCGSFPIALLPGSTHLHTLTVFIASTSSSHQWISVFLVFKLSFAALPKYSPMPRGFPSETRPLSCSRQYSPALTRASWRSGSGRITSA